MMESLSLATAIDECDRILLQSDSKQQHNMCVCVCVHHPSTLQNERDGDEFLDPASSYLPVLDVALEPSLILSGKDVA